MTVGQGIRLSFQSMDETMKRKRSLKIREALEEVIHQAFKQERLVQGVLDATSVLQRHPKDVMFVIWEEAAADKKGLKIQEKLINAFCTENCIKLMKVNRCVALLQTLKQHCSSQHITEETQTAGDSNKYSTHEETQTAQSEEGRLDPVQCILVRKPEVHSNEDAFLTSFYDTLVLNNLTSCPFIRV